MISAVGLILLFAFSLSWVWTALALVVRTPHAVNVGGLVFLFPLTFTSNVFVDPTTMRLAAGVHRLEPDRPPGDGGEGAHARHRRGW